MTIDAVPPSNEERIVAIARHRDRAAFTALFQHFAPRVKSYLQGTGLNAGAAEDLMQDVLLSVWHRAAQFDPARAGANAWVFTIARNLRIDMARRSRLAVPTADPSEAPPAVPLSDALLATAQRSQTLRRAVEALPAEQAALLQLAFFEDRSHSEIVAISGIPLGTIKARLRLAISKLRLALKDTP